MTPAEGISFGTLPVRIEGQPGTTVFDCDGVAGRGFSAIGTPATAVR